MPIFWYANNQNSWNSSQFWNSTNFFSLLRSHAILLFFFKYRAYRTNWITCAALWFIVTFESLKKSDKMLQWIRICKYLHSHTKYNWWTHQSGINLNFLFSQNEKTHTFQWFRSLERMKPMWSLTVDRFGRRKKPDKLFFLHRSKKLWYGKSYWDWKFILHLRMKHEQCSIAWIYDNGPSIFHIQCIGIGATLYRLLERRRFLFEQNSI